MIKNLTKSKAITYMAIALALVAIYYGGILLFQKPSESDK